MTWSMDPCWGAGYRMLVTRAGGWLTGWVTGWITRVRMSSVATNPDDYEYIFN